MIFFSLNYVAYITQRQRDRNLITPEDIDETAFAYINMYRCDAEIRQIRVLDEAKEQKSEHPSIHLLGS